MGMNVTAQDDTQMKRKNTIPLPLLFPLYLLIADLLPPSSPLLCHLLFILLRYIS